MYAIRSYYEYRYFRTRYPRADDESAFVLLTDAFRGRSPQVV